LLVFSTLEWSVFFGGEVNCLECPENKTLALLATVAQKALDSASPAMVQLGKRRKQNTKRKTKNAAGKEEKCLSYLTAAVVFSTVSVHSKPCITPVQSKR
jgi:hypothetical protein